MDDILWVLLALGTIAFTPIIAAALLARAAVKRIRRNPAIGGAVLRSRAQLSTGPHRKVLRLRVRLGETLTSGQAALDLAGHGAGQRGELPRLFGRIQREGAALDAQLRLLESERDSSVLSAELPAAERRVDLLTDLVRRLRSAVAAGLTSVSDDSLTSLRGDVEREVAALAAGVQELQTLSRRDDLIEPKRRPSIDGLNRWRQGTES
jgi:hypothetical protein